MSDKQDLDIIESSVDVSAGMPESGIRKGFDDVLFYDLSGSNAEHLRRIELIGDEAFATIGEMVFSDNDSSLNLGVDILRPPSDAGTDWRRDPRTVLQLGRKRTEGDFSGRDPLTVEEARRIRASLRDIARGAVVPKGLDTPEADRKTVISYTQFLIPRIVAAAEMVQTNGGHVTLEEVNRTLHSLGDPADVLKKP